MIAPIISDAYQKQSIIVYQFIRPKCEQDP